MQRCPMRSQGMRKRSEEGGQNKTQKVAGNGKLRAADATPGLRVSACSFAAACCISDSPLSVVCLLSSFGAFRCLSAPLSAPNPPNAPMHQISQGLQPSKNNATGQKHRRKKTKTARNAISSRSPCSRLAFLTSPPDSPPLKHATAKGMPPCWPITAPRWPGLTPVLGPFPTDRLAQENPQQTAPPSFPSPPPVPCFRCRARPASAAGTTGRDGAVGLAERRRLAGVACCPWARPPGTAQPFAGSLPTQS